MQNIKIINIKNKNKEKDKNQNKKLNICSCGNKIIKWFAQYFNMLLYSMENFKIK